MIHPSVLERVHRVREWVPTGLVSDASWSRVERAAVHLPVPCSGISLECHLCADRVDLIARLEPDQAAVARDCEALDPSTRQVLRRWTSPDDPLSEVPWFDLEVDLDGASEVLFACPSLEPNLIDGPVVVGDRRRHTRDPDGRLLARTALDALLDEPLDPGLARSLERTFDALPPGGHIHYAQPMWLRGPGAPRAIRVIVSLPRPSVADTLAALGWTGDLQLLRERCDAVGSYHFRIDLDLDIGVDGPGPRVALYAGFLFPDPRAPELHHLTRLLQDRAAVASERIEALVEHFARTRSARVGPLRPVQLKFFWDRDPTLRAKAYLSFSD